MRNASSAGSAPTFPRQRLRGVSRRFSRRPQAGRRPRFEALEDRRLLAGNLSITDIYWIDGAGSRLEAPAVGSRVLARVEFQEQNLAAGEQYFVQFLFDSAPVSEGPITASGGTTTVIVESPIDFLITPGTHTLGAMLDPNNQVSEIVEGDNFLSVTFDPITFQSGFNHETRFVTPLGGVPNQDWSIVNYVDVDPSSGASDFLGGNYTYDGHDALDMSLANFAAMDVGLPVFAAAGGVVVNLDHIHPDRNTVWCGALPPEGPLPQSNFVVINHGGGWRTIYHHLRTDSVAVEVGDVIKAGQTLGLAGSSGCSTDAHLHFAVYYRGRVVETYLDPGAYWHEPLAYAGDTPGALDFGTTDHAPDIPELKERPAERSVFPALPGQRIHFWSLLHGIRAGDTLSVVWSRPNGSAFHIHAPYSPGETRYGWQTYFIDLPLAPDLGVWRVALFHNGQMIAEDDFLVSNDAVDLAGAIQFNAANYTINENKGFAVVTVTRTSAQGAASIEYQTLNFTAKAGSDYVSTAGTLTFNNGEFARTFTVPLIDDDSHAPDEKLLLLLTSPTGGSLGGQWLAGLNIADDDALLNLEFDGNRLNIRAATEGIQDDTVTVDVTSEHFVVDVNGEQWTFPIAWTAEVALETGAGADTIDLYGTKRAISLDAGEGDDAIRLGRPGDPFTAFHSLDPIQGFVNLDAGAGSDSLAVRDNWLLGPGHVYDIFRNSFLRSGGKNVFWEASLESLTVLASHQDDTINVRGAVTSTFVDAGGGDDVLATTPQQKDLEDVTGLTVVGGPGENSLVIHDQNNPYSHHLSHLYVLAAGIVGRWFSPSGPLGFPLFASIAYDQISSLTVNAGQLADVIDAHSVSAPTTIHAGGGDDTVRVSPQEQNMQKTAGLTVIGGPGENSLVINDQNNPYSHHLSHLYVLTPGMVGRWFSLSGPGGFPLFAAIGYEQIAALNLHTGGGADVVQVSSMPAAAAVHIDAGAGADALIGPDAANTFTLAGSSAGTLSSSGAAAAWSSFENLRGGSDSDTFLIQDGQGLSGFLEGAGGVDTLDYSPYLTDVAVNLATGVATGIAGSVSGVENAIGGWGNDLLRGDAIDNVLQGGPGDDVLLGADGADQLHGGAGRDLLLGGAAADLLFGGGDEDILIGGGWEHDDNDLALLALMAEWRRADLNYNQRRSHLMTGAGNNGPYMLDKKTVTDDGAADTLSGEGDLDWFFAHKNDDDVSDEEPGEKVTHVK